MTADEWVNERAKELFYSYDVTSKNMADLCVMVAVLESQMSLSESSYEANMNTLLEYNKEIGLGLERANQIIQDLKQECRSLYGMDDY